MAVMSESPAISQSPVTESPARRLTVDLDLFAESAGSADKPERAYR
jgi:hypothetical protein